MPLTSSQQEHLHFKDHRGEARLFGVRIMGAFGLVLLFFALLLYRYYQLQVVHYHDYATRADSNRIQVRAVPPTRGLIYDRNGVLLADNRASYTLSIVRERTSDLEQTLEKIGQLITLQPSDLDNFHRAVRQRRRPFEPIPLRYRLTEEEIARIAVNEYQLDGVEVEAQLVRHYPYRELFAHSIGYVGRINERELSGFDELTHRAYGGTHTIGKVGIERFYEQYLLGEVGSQHIEANAHGRVLREVERVEAQPGRDLVLHLDLELQQVAHQALGDFRGAIVAMDIHTGGILASVSTPSYDPNLFVTGISNSDYQALSQSQDLPLFNRTIQGQYPPGSVLKPMFGVGALQSRAVTTNLRINDPGFYRLPGSDRIFRDWRRGGHGSQVDLRQAIVESCNTYFYELAVRMGIDEMHPLGTAFGLGARTGVDLPSERAGLWPSREWKRGARGLPWFPGDSLNVSIGQGDVLATPMQLAVLTSALATRGKLIRPSLVAAVGDQALERTVLSQWHADESHWDYVDSSMVAVVHGTRGTARGIARGVTYKIAGKTGTAQLVGIAQDAKYDRDTLYHRNWDQALFIGYAPADNPEIAVAVFVENGEGGATTAAPMARTVMDAWLGLQAERKTILPTPFAGRFEPAHVEPSP